MARQLFFGDSCDSVISSISEFSELGSETFEGFTERQERDLAEFGRSSISQANQLFRRSMSLQSQEVQSLRNFTSELLLDDISELRSKCEQLQKQMENLSVLHEEAEQKIVKHKTEYAVLKTNYYILEEQKRDVELRSQQRLKEEQLFNKELLRRKDRESVLEKETSELKIRSLESEVNSLKEELKRERLSNEQERKELRKQQIEVEPRFERPRKRSFPRKTENERVFESEIEFLKLKLAKMEMRSEQDRNSNSSSERNVETLKDEVEFLKDKNIQLIKDNEDLQAVLMSRSVDEGQSFLNGNHESLAFELESRKETELEEDLRMQLKDQKESNENLRKYIDSVLLKIVEHNPQFLEIK
ncbi:RAB11FIP4 family protein [Megaselia abdita]